MTLKELIQTHHKPELLKKPGMVYQLWEDGELTLQKSGELLWQRNLHCIEPGLPGVNHPMPMPFNSHSFMVVESKEIADTIRQALKG